MKKQRLENFLYSKLISFIIIFVILLSTCYTEKVFILDYSVSMISLLFSIIIILFYLLNCEISKICLSLIVYCIFLFISCLLGEKSSMSLFFINYYRIIALAFYLDYGLKYYSKNVVRSFYLSYFILTLFNFYTLIRYPNGWYSSRLNNRNWFFKYDNAHIFMFIPALMFMFLDKKIFKRILNVFDYLLLIMITYSVFFCFSATSVIGYAILLLYLLFRKYLDGNDNIFNSVTYLLTYLATFMGFIILRIQKIFSFLLVKILKKDLTFSGRTIIWDNIMKFIKQQPFLGYGMEEASIITKKLGANAYTHAHNTILDILYKGGIISLLIFFIMIILPVNELYKNKENEISKFLSIILFSIFIMINFEARQENIGLYLVLVSCFNIGHILNHIKESKT